MDPLERPVERGDIVVFSRLGEPTKLLVQRVVALEGDEVEFRDKQFVRNGRPVSEDYVTHVDPKVYSEGDGSAVGMARDQMPSRTVGPGMCFLLGDNRDNSLDSRFFGEVPISQIAGRVDLKE